MNIEMSDVLKGRLRVGDPEQIAALKKYQKLVMGDGRKKTYAVGLSFRGDATVYVTAKSPVEAVEIAEETGMDEWEIDDLDVEYDKPEDLCH